MFTNRSPASRPATAPIQREQRPPGHSHIPISSGQCLSGTNLSVWRPSGAAFSLPGPLWGGKPRQDEDQGGQHLCEPRDSTIHLLLGLLVIRQTCPEQPPCLVTGCEPGQPALPSARAPCLGGQWGLQGDVVGGLSQNQAPLAFVVFVTQVLSHIWGQLCTPRHGPRQCEYCWE